MLLELNNNIATIKDTTLEELKQFMAMANVNTIDSVVINMAKEEAKEVPQPIEVSVEPIEADEEPEVDENLLVNDIAYKYDISYNTLYTWKKDTSDIKVSEARS